MRATRKKYIACFDDFYGTAIKRIPCHYHESFSMLDPGAGTGLFAALVKQVYPHARLTLSDIFVQMLAQARARFAADDSVSVILNDYIQEPLTGRYDVIISGLSLPPSTAAGLQADKPLPLAQQSDLRQQAGFTQCNCWYQYYRLRYIGGCKTV